MPAAAADRGSLTVAPKVVTKIAEAAAAEVDGTAPHRGGVGHLLGRSLPRADARLAGSRADVSLEVAAVWPHPVATVAARVRDSVTRRLQELADVTVDRADVTVSHVLPRSSAGAGRRVQ